MQQKQGAPIAALRQQEPLLFVFILDVTDHTVTVGPSSAVDPISLNVGNAKIAR
jgi:hypothetical protein